MLKCGLMRLFSSRRIYKLTALKPEASLRESITASAAAHVFLKRCHQMGSGRPVYDSSHQKGNDGSVCEVYVLMLVASMMMSCAYCEDDNRIGSDKTRNNYPPLSRYFVVDAIDSVAPAVVNIICSVEGYLVSGVSSGSGFIITEDGFVVTNAHVVASSRDGKVLVTTMNGKKRTGAIHSIDTASDIALVKLDSNFDGERFPTASLGASGSVRTGEFVIALGSPLQLQNSASFGIVSATARHASELGLANNRSEYIQTDSAINVGNSGGPLINLNGEVIGINTMKVRGTDGISFAIPIDTAAQVIRQLMLNRKVVRPYVGLKLANYISGRKEKRHGSTHSRGITPSDLLNTQDAQVIVIKVEKNSPAEIGGFQR